MYDVIIPALNEAHTVSGVVRAFTGQPNVQRVFVAVDAATTDATARVASFAGAHVLTPQVSGKGQLVTLALEHTDTPRVVLSDADYTRITSATAWQVVAADIPDNEMRIAIPRMPVSAEWKDSGFNVPFDAHAWAVNSGLRSFPASMVQGVEFHGYLLETMLNRLAREKGIPVSMTYCASLRAPLRFTERRLKAMEEDRQWGIDHGVFSEAQPN